MGAWWSVLLGVKKGGEGVKCEGEGQVAVVEGVVGAEEERESSTLTLPYLCLKMRIWVLFNVVLRLWLCVSYLSCVSLYLCAFARVLVNDKEPVSILIATHLCTAKRC